MDCLVIQKLTKFLTLSGAEQRLWLLAALLLPVMWVFSRTVPFNRLLRWLDRAPSAGRPAVSLEEIATIGSLVNSAAFHTLGPNNCLVRSLFLKWLLRRKGVECELRLGTRFEDGAFKAHAWVEVRGRPVNDAADVGQRFAAFDQPLVAGRFPSP